MSASPPPALQAPPRCLAGHSVRLADFADKRNVLICDWTLSCASCREDRFELWKIVARYETGERQTIGIRTRCVPCGHEATVFDGAYHGYDGELGHVDFLRGERTTEPVKDLAGLGPAGVRVMVQTVFNTDLAELEEISSDEEIAVRDLFDWFNLYISDPGKDWRHVWDWECA